MKFDAVKVNLLEGRYVNVCGRRSGRREVGRGRGGVGA